MVIYDLGPLATAWLMGEHCWIWCRWHCLISMGRVDNVLLAKRSKCKIDRSNYGCSQKWRCVLNWSTDGEVSSRPNCPLPFFSSFLFFLFYSLLRVTQWFESQFGWAHLTPSKHKLKTRVCQPMNVCLNCLGPPFWRVSFGASIGLSEHFFWPEILVSSLRTSFDIS